MVLGALGKLEARGAYRGGAYKKKRVYLYSNVPCQKNCVVNLSGLNYLLDLSIFSP